jgi:hypothetical protein
MVNFLAVVSPLRNNIVATDGEYVDAFIAFGGNANLTGVIDVQQIDQILKEFELNISIE